MAMQPRTINLETLPPEVLIPIFRLAVGFTEDPSFGPRDSSVTVATIPMTHICRQIRTHIVGYPPFWSRISSRMSRNLQVACLTRSRDTDIHVSLVCAHPSHYVNVDFTLDIALSRSHRWATFNTVLCPEALQQNFYYCEISANLYHRTSFPRLRKINIKYLAKQDLTNFTYPSADIGGYGGFYTNWIAPLLTDLTVVGYFPYPAIAPTITTLTAKFDNQMNESHLIRTLSNASSLKELHLVFSPGARLAGPGMLDGSQYGKYITRLPGIEVFSITMYIRMGWTQSLEKAALFFGDMFRFPNISSFSLVINGRNELNRHSGHMHVLLHRLRAAFLRPLDVLELNGSKAGESTTIKTSRPFPAATKLRIVGKCWDVSPREDVGIDIFQTLEELTLVDCTEDIIPFVKDLTKEKASGGRAQAKARLVRTAKCSPELEEKLIQIVGAEGLNPN